MLCPEKKEREGEKEKRVKGNKKKQLLSVIGLKKKSPVVLYYGNFLWACFPKAVDQTC